MNEKSLSFNLPSPLFLPSVRLVRLVRSSSSLLGVGSRGGGGSQIVPHEAFPLGAHDTQDTVQTASPDHQASLDLGPLLLAKDAVGGAVDEELLSQLRELALDQPGADGINDPFLDVGGRHAQRGGDGGIGQRASGRRRGGQRRQGQQSQLGGQGIAGVGQHAARDRRQRGGGHQGLVGVQGVRGEDLQQLEEGTVAGAQGLHGVGRRQRREVEDGRMLQGGGQGSHGQVARLRPGGVGGGDGLQGLHGVRLAEFVVPGGVGGVRHGPVQVLGVVGGQVPRGEPAGQLGRQLRLQGLERVDRARLADHGDQGQQHRVPAGVGRRQRVEHGRQDRDGQRRAVLRRAGDGRGQVRADPRQEQPDVRRVVHQVDEQVVRRGDFYAVSVLALYAVTHTEVRHAPFSGAAFNTAAAATSFFSTSSRCLTSVSCSFCS